MCHITKRELQIRRRCIHCCLATQISLICVVQQSQTYQKGKSYKQTNAHKWYTHNHSKCTWMPLVHEYTFAWSVQKQTCWCSDITPTHPQSWSIDWPAPKANWSFLTQTNTHNLILCDTSPLGHSEDAAILNQAIIYKLDITPRWQPGSAMYTWINKHKHKHKAIAVLENIPLAVSAHVKVTKFSREILSVNFVYQIMIPNEWFIISLMLTTWCVQQQVLYVDSTYYFILTYNMCITCQGIVIIVLHKSNWFLGTQTQSGIKTGIVPNYILSNQVQEASADHVNCCWCMEKLFND